jgi:hypothetical protein
MDHLAYQRLLVEFCDAGEIANVADFLNDGIFMIDDLPARLERQEESDQVLFSLDLGEPDPLEIGSLLLVLMCHGFEVRMGGSPFYVLHEETGRIVLCQWLPLAPVRSGGGLLEAIEGAAEELLALWGQHQRQARNMPGKANPNLEVIAQIA